MAEYEVPVEDVNTILELVGRLEANDGQIVLGKSGKYWNLAVVAKNEEGDMTVSGFSTGEDLSQVLDDVADELEIGRAHV